MKKMMSAFLALVMALSLAGCGSEPGPAPQEPAAEETTAASSGYDVDLTVMSSTMIYSEVYNMVTAPEDYIGKRVRMNGQFSIYQATGADSGPVSDAIYYACVITDATACCSQGLEFILAGNAVYPDDYPALDEEITVSGIFQTYEEDGWVYCHLVDAILE